MHPRTLPLPLVLLALLLSALLVTGCASDQSIDEEDAVEGTVVTVDFDGSTADVTAEDLTVVTIDGIDCVSLAEVVTASAVVDDPSTMGYDLLASDGFQPTSKGIPPLTFGNLEHGYLMLGSRDVFFDEDQGLAQTYHVKDTTTILVVTLP